VLKIGTTNMKSNASYVITIIIIILVVGIISYALNAGAVNAAIYNELNALKLIPEPEQFTELYFQNSSNLPRETIANEPISFAFTIHNVESTSTVYPYVVYFQASDGTNTTPVVFTTGLVTLADNASTTITVTHTFASASTTGEVVVDLPSLNDQSIDFLLPDTNP
jgi:hypothetical protein